MTCAPLTLLCSCDAGAFLDWKPAVRTDRTPDTIVQVPASASLASPGSRADTARGAAPVQLQHSAKRAASPMWAMSTRVQGTDT